MGIVSGMKKLRRTMSKIRKFTQFSLRDLLAASAPTLALVAGLCYLAYLLVDPTPPRSVTLSTGQFNSAYEEFGKKYAAELARDRIRVTPPPSNCWKGASTAWCFRRRRSRR